MPRGTLLQGAVVNTNAFARRLVLDTEQGIYSINLEDVDTLVAERV